MADSSMLRSLLLAAAILAGIFLLRLGFRVLKQKRLNREWRRVQQSFGLSLEPMTNSMLPRLSGRVEGMECRVQAMRSDSSRTGAVVTQIRFLLAGSSPVQLVLERAGPLSLLGDLARDTFLQAEEPGEGSGDSSMVEGDPSVARALLSGPLAPVISQFEDWKLRIEKDVVLLETPGIADRAERLGGRIRAIAEGAKFLEEAGREGSVS